MSNYETTTNTQTITLDDGTIVETTVTTTVVVTPPATTYFVTRHPGAVEWAEEEGIKVDRMVSHWTQTETDSLRPGDTVVGTLPINIVADVNYAGARYLHLSMEVPAEMRGKELTAEDMKRLGAVLCYYRVSMG